MSDKAMGLLRITSWYPNFNGSHFGLPPSETHRMTGLPPKIVWTMTYSHRPHLLRRKWGPCALCHGKLTSIQNSMEAILAFHPTLSTGRLDWTGWQNGVNGDVFAQTRWRSKCQRECLWKQQTLFQATFSVFQLTFESDNVSTRKLRRP